MPREQIEPEKPQISVEGLEDYELTTTGDGYRFERASDSQLGWGDVLFWAVVLVLARSFT